MGGLLCLYVIWIGHGIDGFVLRGLNVVAFKREAEDGARWLWWGPCPCAYFVYRASCWPLFVLVSFQGFLNSGWLVMSPPTCLTIFCSKQPRLSRLNMMSIESGRKVEDLEMRKVF